jgi:hypothetical protein
MELSAAIEPLRRVRPGERILGQESLAPLADVEHDRPGFEEREVAVLKNRHLSEGLQGAVVRFVLVAQRQKARLVGDARLLQGPARAQIAHLAVGELWNPFESGDGDHALRSFAICAA